MWFWGAASSARGLDLPVIILFEESLVAESKGPGHPCAACLHSFQLLVPFPQEFRSQVSRILSPGPHHKGKALSATACQLFEVSGAQLRPWLGQCFWKRLALRPGPHMSLLQDLISCCQLEALRKLLSSSHFLSSCCREALLWGSHSRCDSLQDKKLRSPA